MPFYFNLELKQGLEKPDYILRFDNCILNSIDYRNHIINYEQFESTLTSTFIIIEYEYKEIKGYENEIKNEIINQIKQIKNIKLNQTNENVYNIIYPKFNDLKFLRILKNTINKYKPLIKSSKVNYEIFRYIFHAETYVDVKIFSNIFNYFRYNRRHCGINFTGNSNEYKRDPDLLKLYLLIDDNIINNDGKTNYVALYETLERNDPYLYQPIKKLLNTIKNLYNILNETIDDNESNYEELINDYKNKIEQLQNENEKLEHKNIEFQKENQQLQNENEQLKVDYEKLEYENIELRKNIDDLKTDYEKLEHNTIEILQNNLELRKDIKRLQDELINDYSNLI